MEKLTCWNCNATMKRIVDNFHGFKINAWVCQKCKDVVYDEADVQPILKYNSKILRIPKVIEKLYNITKGKKVEFEIEPEAIRLKI